MDTLTLAIISLLAGRRFGSVMSALGQVISIAITDLAQSEGEEIASQALEAWIQTLREATEATMPVAVALYRPENSELN